MTGFSIWWRKAGGMLAAVMLATMVFGPTVEAAVCLDDPASAAAGLDQPDGALLNAGLADEGPCEDGACPCVHCQGHHASAYALVALTEAEGPTDARERHALADGPSLASSLTFGFKRPPRG